MVKLSKEEQAVIDVERALLGELDKMNEAIKKTPEQMAKSINKLNLHVQTMHALMKSGKGLTNEQRAYLTSAKDAVENRILPYLKDNEEARMQLKQGIKETKATLEESPRKGPR